MDAKELFAKVKEDGVKFISYQFVDVFGTVKSVDAPISQLEGALENGVWFDGSSVEGFARIQESDMLLRIDPDTYAVLPWSPADLRRARVFCDIYHPDGTPFECDPRGVLKRKMAEYEALKIEIEALCGDLGDPALAAANASREDSPR